MASMSLDSITFDTANPNDEANIGAYLRAGSDGDQLTSTLLGGKEALDVNIAGADLDLTVDIDLNDPVADDDPDTENPLKVGSRGHLQSAVLGALSADSDKADQISDIYRRVWTTSAPNVGWKSEAITVGIAAAQLDTSKQAGRQYVMIQSTSGKKMYIGSDNTVTTSNGLEIGPNAVVALELGEALDVYAISGTAAQEVRFVQVG